MNMIILNEDDFKEIKKINRDNVYLNRAIQPLPLSDGCYALGCDILKDSETWEKWLAVLSGLPQREVSGDEFVAPKNILDFEA